MSLAENHWFRSTFSGELLGTPYFLFAIQGNMHRFHGLGCGHLGGAIIEPTTVYVMEKAEETYMEGPRTYMEGPRSFPHYHL